MEGATRITGAEGLTDIEVEPTTEGARAPGPAPTAPPQRPPPTKPPRASIPQTFAGNGTHTAQPIGRCHGLLTFRLDGYQSEAGSLPRSDQLPGQGTRAVALGGRQLPTGWPAPGRPGP